MKNIIRCVDCGSEIEIEALTWHPYCEECNGLMVVNGKKYTVDFIVYKKGAVSMNKATYGKTTYVAKALREVARCQEIEKKYYR